MEGLGTVEDVLVELCCARTPDKLSAIKKTYSMIYDEYLTKDVSEDTSGGSSTPLLALSDSEHVPGPALARCVWSAYYTNTRVFASPRLALCVRGVRPAFRLTHA